MTARIGFRAVHPDFRSSRGFVWPFPGRIAKAPGPLVAGNTGPCPDAPGDGLCLGLTWRGVASGGIPAITVLVCSFTDADVLGEDNHKVRVKRCKVLRAVDFPATLRSDVPRDPDLPHANLWGADLSGADLRGADLSDADLSDADLRGANLRDADLSDADLWGANLRGADLSDADLWGADLRGANLRGAVGAASARCSQFTVPPAGWTVNTTTWQLEQES